MNNSSHQSNGFILIEALVALVIVAVGAIGIAKLNAILLQGTSASKARAEAIQIAQDHIESARNFILSKGCSDPSLANNNSSFTGINAAFSIITSYPESGANWKAVDVCVTWDGGVCNAVGNRVVLRSVLACEGIGTSAQVGQDGAASMMSGFIRTPTGRGQVGGRQYTNSIPGTDNKITLDGINQNDGTKTHYTSDGNLELIDSATGKVLLTVNRRSCETKAPAFSTISGKLFVEAKNGTPIASNENLYVLSSDASYCSKLPYNNNWVLPSGATGNSIKYFYTYYQCYLGAEWWGNIGLVRVDNANTNNRVCVGHPGTSNNGTLFSRHPQLSTTRAYRGYRTLAQGKYETVGIGETNTVNSDCPNPNGQPTYQYKPQHLTNHHFVHTVITGQASNSSCEAELAALNNYSPTNSLGAGNSPPTVTETADSKIVAANINPGRFYCISNNDGITCQNLGSPPPAPSTLLTGTITAHNGITINSIDANNSACTTSLIESPAAGKYTYSCQIDWSGFTAPSWNGSIAFGVSASGSLCPNNPEVNVTPNGEYVAFSIRGKNAVNDQANNSIPNSIYFSDIPSNVTGISINFDAKVDCGSLGQVDLQWTGNTTPKLLSWNPIANAQNYVVERCTNSNSNSIQSCVPTNPVQTTTNTSYNVGTVDNKETICVRVKATATGLTDGPYSPVKCVHRSGGSYTYQ